MLSLKEKGNILRWSLSQRRMIWKDSLFRFDDQSHLPPFRCLRILPNTSCCIMLIPFFIHNNDNIKTNWMMSMLTNRFGFEILHSFITFADRNSRRLRNHTKTVPFLRPFPRFFAPGQSRTAQRRKKDSHHWAVPWFRVLTLSVISNKTNRGDPIKTDVWHGDSLPEMFPSPTVLRN